MAKSDLLKQAIADAKAVKETALANAKLALQEAFAPRLEGMLSSKLREELEDDDMDVNMDLDAEAEAGTEAGAEVAAGDEMGSFPDSVNVGLDFNDDGDYDLTGILGGEAEEIEAGAEAGAEAGRSRTEPATRPRNDEDASAASVRSGESASGYSGRTSQGAV